MHCPQGGYQSQGNGAALWTDPENQRRLVKLWGEIARRYADEPAIQGDGLINEPVVPELGSAAETVGSASGSCSGVPTRSGDTTGITLFSWSMSRQ